AGELFNVQFPALAGKSNAQKRGFKFMSPRISASQIELMLNDLIAAQRFLKQFARMLGHLVLDFAELVRKRVQPGECELRLIHYRVCGIERGILSQVSELNRPGDRNIAALRGDLTGNDFEKRCLPRPV